MPACWLLHTNICCLLFLAKRQPCVHTPFPTHASIQQRQLRQQQYAPPPLGLTSLPVSAPESDAMLSRMTPAEYRALFETRPTLVDGEVAEPQQQQADALPAPPMLPALTGSGSAAPALAAWAAAVGSDADVDGRSLLQEEGEEGMDADPFPPPRLLMAPAAPSPLPLASPYFALSSEAAAVAPAGWAVIGLGEVTGVHPPNLDDDLMDSIFDDGDGGSG